MFQRTAKETKDSAEIMPCWPCDIKREKCLSLRLEQELVARLVAGEDTVANEDEFKPVTQESKFGEKLLGGVFNPMAKKFRG